MGFATSGIHAGRVPGMIPTINPEDLDEVGGLGDELDHASLRDIAVLRFLRHREWMEAAAGAGGVSVDDITAPELIPTSPGAFTFGDASQIADVIKTTEQEIQELERQVQDTQTNMVDAKSLFLRDSISKLRDEFGTASREQSEKTLQAIYTELETAFDVRVVEKKRVVKIKPNLDLPEYATAEQVASVHDDLGSTGFQLGQIQDSSHLGHEFVHVDDPDSVLGDVLSLPEDL